MEEITITKEKSFKMNHHESLRRLALICTMSMLLIPGLGYAGQDPPVDVNAQQGSYAWETMILSYSSLTDPGETYMELFMSILNGQFTFNMREDGNYYALVQFDLEIKDKEDSVIVDQSWRRAIKVADVVEAEKQASLEMTNFLITPGTYALALSVTDLYANNTSSKSSFISVQRYPTSIVSMSDIEFASIIRAATENNNFVKHNKYYVEPFPRRVYSNANPMLYFYCEIYNLGNPKNDEDTYTVEYQILDHNGERVHYVKKPPKKKPQSPIAVIVEQINTLKLRNDSYNLYIKVSDDATGITTEKRSVFSVFKPNERIAEKSAAGIELEITPNNIQDYWNQIDYITTSGQKKTFESYGFEGKKQFILDFWNGKTSEFYEEHMRRFNYAQEMYKALNIPGWRSDRGRIYIMYGETTTIEAHPFDPGMKPWEAWVYDNLKGQSVVTFIFGDISEFGNYVLLHSDIRSQERGEIYDPNWRQRLIK